MENIYLFIYIMSVFFLNQLKLELFYNSFKSIRNFYLLNKCTSYVSQYVSRITRRKLEISSLENRNSLIHF